MAETVIISNTTPLINFAEVSRMDVLRGLFGSSVIPPAVRDEWAAKRTLFPEAAKVHSLDLISVLPPGNRLLVEGFSASLHRGEAECLALAMERSGCLLLLDDLAAREFAAARGLLFTGTLGCVVEAKRTGLIASARVILEDLRKKARFWISDRLVECILRDVGEL
jgi:uncharacterized protein